MENVHEFENEPEPVRESFRVDDDSKASWAMRKLYSIMSKIEQNQAIRDNEVARVNDWLDSVNGKLQDDANYFINLLEDYHRNERLANGRKTIKLPHGSLSSRTLSEKIRIADPELFVKWAKDVDSRLIRITEVPNQTEINKLLSIDGDNVVVQGTGEVVEGVVVVPESVSFKVEVEKN